MVKIFIDGMGVLGRQLLKYVMETNDVEVVGVNDPNITLDNLIYLLRNDTVYRCNVIVEKSEDSENKFNVNGKQVMFYQLDDNGFDSIDLNHMFGDVTVVDCTGKRTNAEQCEVYFQTGAKGVVLGYTPTGNDIRISVPDINNVLLDMNDKDTSIVSAGDADLIALCHILNFLETYYGVDRVFTDIFQAYTNANNSMDSLNANDFALGRAGAWNISPVKSTSAKMVGKVIPQHNGKVVGSSFRAPVVMGGVQSIRTLLQKSVDLQSLLADLKIYCNTKTDRCLLESDPIVSSDAVGSPKVLIRTDTVELFDSETCSTTVLYDNIMLVVGSIIRILNDAKI